MTEPMTDERLAEMKRQWEPTTHCYSNLEAACYAVRALTAEVERLSKPFKDGIMIKKSTLAIWEKTGEQLEASKVEVERLKEEVYRRDCFLESVGYRSCDTPACNCGRWHNSKRVQDYREFRAAERFCKAALAMDSFDHHPDLLAWKEVKND